MRKLAHARKCLKKNVFSLIFLSHRQILIENRWYLFSNAAA
jgi:hypothetical protein